MMADMTAIRHSRRESFLSAFFASLFVSEIVMTIHCEGQIIWNVVSPLYVDITTFFQLSKRIPEQGILLHG